jgi:O-methyltransferase/methyltransferase family protein
MLPFHGRRVGGRLIGKRSDNGRSQRMTETFKQDETTRLRQLIMGFRVTQLLYVAAKLGIADHLAQGPRTAGDLASVVAADAGALYRLLRALASLGIFAETADGRFELTTTAELLRRDRPGSLRSTALLYGDELLWRAYGCLSLAIETGHSAFEQVYGEPFYDYLSQHPNSASLFHEAMTGFSELEAAAIMAAYDLASVSAVVDVGGGQGALMAAFLRAHPHLRAIILDRSAPTDETQKLFAGSNIAGRGRFIQGDFFASIPDGGDLYVLKSICTTGMMLPPGRSCENVATPCRCMLGCSSQSEWSHSAMRHPRQSYLTLTCWSRWVAESEPRPTTQRFFAQRDCN